MKALFLSVVLFSFFSSATSQEEIINIKSQDDVVSVRARLSELIWQDYTEDSATVESISTNLMPEQILQDRYPWEGSIGSIDKIRLKLRNNIESNIFVIHPKISNRLRIPIIYHGGHGGAFWEDKYWNNDESNHPVSVIRFFLDRGFEVVVLDMPLIGENRKLYLVNRRAGSVFVKDHPDLFHLRKPFYYFLEPIRKTIDLLEQQYGFKNFAMMGLSGGAWATTLYSAADTRIKRSYAVAGSIPVPFRTKANDWGDEEQTNPVLYNEINYSTLYTLAASGKGRLHYQILNKYDQCCFAMDGSKWKNNVISKLQNIEDEGQYKFMTDTFAEKHMISSVSLDTIYSDLLKNFIPDSEPLKFRLNKLSPNRRALLCMTDSLLIADAVPGQDSLQWYMNNEPILQETAPYLLPKEPGKYFVKITNISQMEFLSDTFTLLEFPRPVISKNDYQLNAESRGNIQWFLNGDPLPWATQKIIEPKIPGTYTAVASWRNCISPASTPFYFGTIIYPNPTYSEVNIQLDKSLGKVEFKIIDVNGHILLKGSTIGPRKIQLPVHGHGIYFIMLSNNTGYAETRKLMVR